MIEILFLYAWWTVLVRVWRGYTLHALAVGLYIGTFLEFVFRRGAFFVDALLLFACLIVFAVGWPRLVRIQRQQRAADASGSAT